MSRFRAFWPIVDEDRTWNELLQEAAADIPTLTVRAGARIIGPIRWTIVPSASVAGSGNVTESVLMCDAPAEERPSRAYRAGAA